VGLSLLLVGLYVSGRAARRAWRRRQGLAHGGTRPLGGSREGEAAKDRIFDGAFSQDADSDDL
jgi:hypothetical protein